MGKEKIILIFIIILTLGLRLIAINQSFWLDEASQAVTSAHSLNSIWFGRAVDFHPPLFYILSHFWQVFGTSEWFLRLLPIFFAVLSVPAMYFFAKTLFPASKSAGLIAAFLLAIAPFHIYYSQEYRSYSLLMLLGLSSYYFLFKKKFFSLSLVNALLLYTHYSAFFLLLAQLVSVVFLSPRDLKKYLMSCLISTILFLPWLPQLLHQLNTGINIDQYLPGWRQVLSLSPVKALPLVFFKLVAGRINLFPIWIYAVYILFVLIVTVFSFCLPLLHRRFFFTWIFVPVLTMIAISFVLPQTQPFRLIYILPALILIFTSACLKYPKLFSTLFIYIAIVGNLAYFTRPRLQREQWRQTLEFISAHPAPVILKFSDKFAPISWYAPRLSTISPVSSFPALSTQAAPVLLAQISNLRRVYLLNYLTDLTDPDHVLDSTLTESGWKLTHTYNFEGVGFLFAYDRIKP